MMGGKRLALSCFVLIIVSGLLIVLPNESRGIAGTIYVDDDAVPGWYDATHVHTIQEGIDSVTSEDTVYVYSGTYYEHISVNKRINLIGEDRNSTIIDGGGNGDVVIVTADLVNISGFTIRNGGASWPDAGVKIYYSSTNTISNCNISNNRGGIFLESSSNNMLTSNTVSNNNLEGIYLGYSSNNTITGNTVSNNIMGIFLNLNYCNICSITTW